MIEDIQLLARDLDTKFTIDGDKVEDSHAKRKSHDSPKIDELDEYLSQQTSIDVAKNQDVLDDMSDLFQLDQQLAVEFQTDPVVQKFHEKENPSQNSFTARKQLIQLLQNGSVESKDVIIHVQSYHAISQVVSHGFEKLFGAYIAVNLDRNDTTALFGSRTERAEGSPRFLYFRPGVSDQAVTGIPFNLVNEEQR